MILRRSIPVILILCVGASAGCATKRYGKQAGLSAKERKNLTCQEIESEITKVDDFLIEIADTPFELLDVLSILPDFFTGKLMEREEAIESGKNRLEELEALKLAKRCAYAAEPQVTRAE